KPAVHHLSGAFEAGSLTAITGPNGAGKSTLLKAISGILYPDEGHIHFAGNVQPVGYLPQTAEIQRDIPMTALELVASGFWYGSGSFGGISAKMRGEAQKALASVGLAGFETCDLLSLSVGQFQRLLFARLAVQNAQLILLDEPFAAVDAQTTERLLELIHVWHAEGRTIICVLHDLEMIAREFPQCLLMARERIAWGASEEVLRPENLATAGHFHAAWTGHVEVCEQ
ncbi:MAG: metal ABC transporter ATP-binding protein, partial [Alphaproteobacteria bacterium]